VRSSTDGACLRRDDSSSSWAPNKTFPGTTMTGDQQCVKKTSNSKASVYSVGTADEFCKTLKCKFPFENGYRITWNGKPPLDGTSCGTGGVRMNLKILRFVDMKMCLKLFFLVS